MNNVNYLGNLQLLDGTQNKEKNDSDFDVWLADNYKDSSKLKDYKEKNYIPDVSLAFTNFEEFFTEREKLLVNRLKKRTNVGFVTKSLLTKQTYVRIIISSLH